jgi:arsenite methyltransferase
MARSSGVTIGLSAWATALAIVSCYGTLILVAVLSLLGLSLAAEARVWARGAVVLFAALATAGLAASSTRQRRWAPLVLSAAGFLLTFEATYGLHSRLVEAAGFALLVLAAVWDRRVRAACELTQDGTR